MFAIVGAGDVVSRLVLPALRSVGVSGWEVHGLLSDPSVLADGTRVYRHSVESLPAVVSGTELVPWLATPPFDARLPLLEAASAAGRRFVVEKPLGLTALDAQVLASSSLLAHAFALSYYVQGKFAPLLWALGLAPVPSLLRGQVRGGLRVAGELASADVVLAEPLERAPDSRVSAWAVDNMLEFAVHAPAVLCALGFSDFEVSWASAHRVQLSGPGVSAVVSRPAPRVRRVWVRVGDVVLCADAGDRSVGVVSPGGGFVALDEGVLSYVPLVAAVLDWLDGGPGGDECGQLRALQILASSGVG